MRYITDKNEKIVADKYIEEAKIMAQKATCSRAKCGAVIVKDEEIIGRGFNSPPYNDEKERRCENKKNEYDIKVTDKTCCMHAEQRAIMDALRNHADKLEGSKLYFSRFYSNGKQRLTGGREGKNQLYCTVCTKMMFDVGVAEFILPHVKGIGVYLAEEYLVRSFGYGKYDVEKLK
ncbi:MAG: deaminase [Candidatus Paceibacterota bacterium]